MWHRIKSILQVIILVTAILVSFMHGPVLGNPLLRPIRWKSAGWEEGKKQGLKFKESHRNNSHSDFCNIQTVRINLSLNRAVNVAVSKEFDSSKLSPREKGLYHV